MKQLISIFLVVCCAGLMAQRVPSKAENIDYFSVFGKDSEKSWGDDDFTQTVFFVIPKRYRSPFFIRVFDADVGGDLDENNDGFNTTMQYSVYGGRDAFSEESKNVDPVEGFDSGTKIYSKTVGNDPSLDKKWMNLGPFNPIDGQLVPELGGYIFKFIIQGKGGNDGNLFSLFLSTSNSSNRVVDGANAFTYEYSVRLPSRENTVSHVFPYITPDITAITQSNFDFDSDGQLLVYSVSKNRHKAEGSGDNSWSKSKHIIDKEEINTSIDLQIVRKTTSNNDMVIYLLNQYNKSVSFFSSPIGGIPVYKYSPKIKTTN